MRIGLSNLQKSLILCCVSFSINLLAEDAPSNTANTSAHAAPAPSAPVRRSVLSEDNPRFSRGLGPSAITAPVTFGNGQQQNTLTPIIPQMVVPQTLPEKDNKRDWIYAKPGDNSTEDIFKLKGSSSGKDKSTQTPLSRFLSEGRESKSEDASKTDRSPQSEAEKENPKATSIFSRDTGRNDREVNKSFGTDRTGDQAVNPGGSKSSMFSDYFGGDFMTQERWKDSYQTRQKDFDQLYQTSSSSDSKSAASSLHGIGGLPGGLDSAGRPSAFGTPGNTLNSSLSRQPGEDVRIHSGLPAASIGGAAVDISRPRYAPAVLPFPKRPGDVFK